MALVAGHGACHAHDGGSSRGKARRARSRTPAALVRRARGGRCSGDRPGLGRRRPGEPEGGARPDPRRCEAPSRCRLPEVSACAGRRSDAPRVHAKEPSRERARERDTGRRARRSRTGRRRSRQSGRRGRAHSRPARRGHRPPVRPFERARRREGRARGALAPERPRDRRRTPRARPSRCRGGAPQPGLHGRRVPLLPGGHPSPAPAASAWRPPRRARGCSRNCLGRGARAGARRGPRR